MKKIFTLIAAAAVALGMSAEVKLLRGSEPLANGAEIELGFLDGQTFPTWNPNLFIQGAAGTACTVTVASNSESAQFCGGFDSSCAVACPSVTKSGTLPSAEPLPLEIHLMLLPGQALGDDVTIEVTVFEDAAPDAKTTVKFNIVDMAESELGISSIVAGDENAPVEYFNVQGVRVNNPVAGALYIVRQGSKVSKVIL